MSSLFQFWLEDSIVCCLLQWALITNTEPTKLDPNLPNFSMIAKFSKILNMSASI